MAKPSCTQECKAPFYIAMSLTLAVIAFTTIKHTRPENPLQTGHAVALNASRALRHHDGFHVIATLLQISPELFLSPGPETTIFAIQDSAFSNLSIPPPAMRQLLRYHTSPSALPSAEIFKKPIGFCFRTLETNMQLMITSKKDWPNSSSVMINDVLVTHPDMFLQGPVTIHGVSGPFDVISSPLCRFSGRENLLRPNANAKSVDWTRIIRFLSSNGFMSFAIGLNSVLDGILQDYEGLGFVTILAPPNSGFISYPSPLLDRIVKLHILPQRFGYVDLVTAADGNSSLRTLVPGCDLKIDKFASTLVINGVGIIGPDIFTSKNFVIHGISRGLEVDELFSS